MAETPADEQAIFEVARKIDSRESRNTYLKQTCGDDAALQQRVATLLRAYEESESFLESPPPGLEADPSQRGECLTIDRPITEGRGSVIGPYKLLQQIGEGGMGVVFMAEQAEPIQRTVALKIIKPGMDTRQVIARFEAERQAVAMMDHPNIAKVLDAGTTDSGRPYFVMELVKGIAITKYCDEKHLPLRARLELFVEVCQAVQHAHQKGIIHRDIKPNNVLVAEYDNRAVPKVIDFGVAKATAQRLTERTMFTEFGQVLGTMEYMSPEQAKLNQLDIDTRSDIYSLGVLLYELLAGSTPFEGRRLKEAAFDEMLRIIREEEPPKPSTRLSTTDQLPSIAANRALEPKKLSGLVKGELDWIVMRCLEKDRSRRFETANEFAADIQRYLHNEPVQACPPSAAYRFQKFVRRNKGPVLASAVLLLTLVGGIVGTTLGLVRAEQARWAEADRAEGERQAKQEAQAVLEFVENKVFAAARPQGQDGGLGYEITLRRAIEAALPYVDESFADRPLIEARLRQTLGNSFKYLGEAKIAAEQFVKARALYTKHRGPDHADTLESMDQLANSFEHLGRHTEALKLREELLALRKAKLGPDHPDTLKSTGNVAKSYYDLGRPEDSCQLHEATLMLMKAKLGPDHENTLATMSNLAISYYALGRRSDALKLREENLALTKTKLGPAHPVTLGSMNNLAISYSALDRHAEALKLNEETLALRKAKLGPDHPETLVSMNNLAYTYRSLGRHAEAVTLDEETLALLKAKLGPDHPLTLLSMSNVALSYTHLGRHSDAYKLNEETLALMKGKLGLDHPDTLVNMSRVANSYATLGRHAEAIKLCEETLALQKVKFGSDHQNTLATMSNLATSYDALGRHAEALKLREATLSIQKDKLGPDHSETLRSMSYVATSYDTLDRDAEALKLREETLLLQKAKLGPVHPDTLASMSNLANSYDALGRDAEALKLREETLQLQKAKLGRDHPNTLTTMHNLANSYDDIGRDGEALKLREENLALTKSKFGPEHLDTLGSMNNLALSYNAVGRLADACKLHEVTLAQSKSKLGLDHPNTLKSMYNLANSYVALDRHAEALMLREELLALQKTKLGPDHPDTLLSMNNLAWTLATGADPQLRDPRRAVELAKQIVASAPDQGNYWNTLGVANYRGSDWKAAVESLERPTELRNGGDAFDWFFLAMAHWQLGHKDEARKWYEQAEEWMKKNKPKNKELIRFCVEAAELLEMPVAAVGDQHASEGRLTQAEKQYARFVRASPANQGAALRLAFLRLAIDDRDGYATVCREMLERSADTKDPHAARRTALVCLISVPPVGQLEPLQRLADVAVAASETSTEGSFKALARRERGLAAYRAGDWKGALQWCRKSRELTERNDYAAQNLIVEAMALYQEGDLKNARASYDAATENMADDFPNAPDQLGPFWFEWLTYKPLQREAAALLGISEPPSAAHAQPVAEDESSGTNSAPASPPKSDN